MRINLAVLALIVYASAAQAAPPRTSAEWEKCRDKAEASVDQRMVGTSGVEAAIKQRCGEPPTRALNPATGAVGMHPYDVVRSREWKPKFMTISKGTYKALVDRLVVSDNTKLEGEWIVGDGMAPHSGGVDEAAIAINTRTGEVFSAVLENGQRITGYGFNGWNNAPPFLKQWANARH